MNERIRIIDERMEIAEFNSIREQMFKVTFTTSPVGFSGL
jgi:hypothetical protein